MTPIKLADGRYLYHFRIGYPEEGADVFATHDSPTWTTATAGEALGRPVDKPFRSWEVDLVTQLEALGFAAVEIPEIAP